MLVLSLNKKLVLKNLHNLIDFFDFGNLKKNHQNFSNKIKRVFGKFKIETLKNVLMEKFVCGKSEAYSFNCGSDNKNRQKSISKSQSENIKFE